MVRFHCCCVSILAVSWKTDWPLWRSRMPIHQVIRMSQVWPVSGLVTFFSWRFPMKYFLHSFPPFRWFMSGNCQFLAKECTQLQLLLVNRLKEQACLGKVWLGSSRPRWLSWMRRPTGNQVAGSTPPRSATFFPGDWSWNIFYGHSLPSADSRRAVVSFWQKNVHNTG